MCSGLMVILHLVIDSWIDGKQEVIGVSCG
jgi:hypothetical protein